MNAVMKTDDRPVGNRHIFAIVNPDPHPAGPFSIQHNSRKVQHKAIGARTSMTASAEDVARRPLYRDESKVFLVYRSGITLR